MTAFVWQEVTLGSARLALIPLEPLAWQELAAGQPGPAGLCLALLAHARVRWRGAPGPWHPGQGARLQAGALEPLLAALCAPWTSPRETAELAVWETYLRFRLDYPGLDCPSCRQGRLADEAPPACRACPLPPAPPDAGPVLEIWRLLNQLPPGAAPLLGTLARDPRQARRLALRLALLARLTGTGPAPGGGAAA